MGRPDAAVLVRRAISVQLATVARGQPRLLQSTRTGRSAAYTGVAALFPKLIFQLHLLPDPCPLRARSGRRPGCLTVTNGQPVNLADLRRTRSG